MYTVLFLPRVIFAFLLLSTVSSRHDFVQTQYWSKWIDTFSKKHTYLKTSCIYLRIVLISISLKFVGPLATRAKWTIIKRGQIIPCRYCVKQQIDIVIHPSVLIPSASPSTYSLANRFWSATLLTWSETLGERRWSF